MSLMAVRVESEGRFLLSDTHVGAITRAEKNAEMRGKAVAKPPTDTEGSGVAGKGKGGEGHPNIKYG